MPILGIELVNQMITKIYNKNCFSVPAWISLPKKSRRLGRMPQGTYKEQGTYKNHTGNTECSPCPEGMTTVADSPATSIDDCIGKL